MEQAFIKQIVGEAFDGKELELRTQIGIRDPVIEGMAAAWRRELAERGAGGRLYTEGLGSALAVHVFRPSGDGLSGSPPVIGGPGALRLRRVADSRYAHPAPHLSLPDMARSEQRRVE